MSNPLWTPTPEEIAALREQQEAMAAQLAELMADKRGPGRPRKEAA